MKKIYYTIICVLLLVGCENNFDPKIYGSLSTSNFPQTEADYENYMLLAYLPFGMHWGYDLTADWSDWQSHFYVLEGGIVRAFDSHSDLNAPWVHQLYGEPVGNNNMTYIYMPKGDFEFMKLLTDGGSNMGNFAKIRFVTRVTGIIGTLEESEILAPDKKAALLGEAHLLRGMLMYYLFHYYGPFPVIVDPALVGDSEAEAKLVRPSLDEMVGYITDDLEFAVANMVESQSAKGRYTRDYARFCLMRHYLNEGAQHSDYYQKAYQIFDQFTGSYALFTEGGDDAYKNQFLIGHKFNSEVIMAVSSAAKGNDINSNFTPYLYYMLPGDMASAVDASGKPVDFGSPGSTPTFVGYALQGSAPWCFAVNMDPVFYDTFEAGDLRLKTVETQYIANDGVLVTRADIGVRWDGFIVNKYAAEENVGFPQGNDVPLARWADALLLRAEADVRAHNTVSSDAISKVNAVRARAGLSPLGADKTSSVAAFLDALLLERGHELFYEGGRKVDLIRFGKYYTVTNALGRAPSSQYFPIPDNYIRMAQEKGHTLSQYYTRPDYDGPSK
jgi:hypothetical protein